MVFGNRDHLHGNYKKNYIKDFWLKKLSDNNDDNSLDLIFTKNTRHAKDNMYVCMYVCVCVCVLCVYVVAGVIGMLE